MVSMLIILSYSAIAFYFVFYQNLKISHMLLPLLCFAIIALIALGQNYTMSFIREANDGIGISNFVATFLLPGDGWSYALFRSYYNNYLALSILLLIVYTFAILFENRFVWRNNQNKK